MTIDTMTIPSEAANRVEGSRRGRHILTVVMQNQQGVLGQICSMLGTRGFDIVSLAVGEAEDPRYSRMILLVVGDGSRIELARKRLEGIVSVLEVLIVTEDDLAKDLEKAVNALLNDSGLRTTARDSFHGH
jgi:acetolactate synthase-1/3 small subunit